MARYRTKNRRTRTQKLLVCAGVALLAGWGIWNAMVLSRTLHANMRGRGENDSDHVVQLMQTAQAQPTDPFVPQADLDMTPPSQHNANPGRAMLSPQRLAELQDRGTRALAAGNIVAGRNLLNEALNGTDDQSLQQDMRDRLAPLNGPVFLGRDILQDDPYARLVPVQPGDTFVKIGHRYAVPAEFLAAINPQLSARNLRPGAGIKIVYGPFHARVVKHDDRMDLYARDMYVQSFPVQFDEGNYLPAGLYHVSRGGKIAVAGTAPDRNGDAPGFHGQARRWLLCDGTADSGETIAACIYGSAGPRATGRIGLSGVKCSDDTLAQLYNTMVEQQSLLRVDP